MHSFSAAILGEPRAVLEDEVRCEYPEDVDDENIADDGFLPALPGESTRISSALALFRSARIFASVLDEVYPARASHQLSFRRLAELNEDLDSWSSDLPTHLRLQFVQDKPSTNVVGSRSPFLVKIPDPILKSVLNVVSVIDLSLHTHADPSAFHHLHQSPGLNLSYRACRVKQAYHPDTSIA